MKVFIAKIHKEIYNNYEQETRIRINLKDF